VRTTDPAAVTGEVRRIFLELYPDASPALLEQAFSDVTLLFEGRFPGIQACDTPYHNLQHTLDVTLAMARLADGYERARNAGMDAIDTEMFQLGVVTALFHDIGYLREVQDRHARNGAEYTLTHVSRGARFLQGYLPGLGLGSLRDVAARLIHFTGYEIPVAEIQVPHRKFRVLGNLLGSADIISQMSDRCYLEKCRDRLYPEFVAGGIARWRDALGREQVLYASGEDLVMKTPGFYGRATRRLEEELAGCFRVAERHFGGQNLYLEELDKNIRFAREVTASGDLSVLRRVPPGTSRADTPPTAAPPSTTPAA
jgi:hypothetical protein